MNLSEKLAEQQERASARWTPEHRAARERHAHELVEAGVAQDALGVGDRAPDFQLVDVTGASISSLDLKARGPVVIVFYRGGWCPYCSLELRAWQQELSAVELAGASLVAISPEAPEVGALTSSDNQLGFPALHDRGNDLAKEFGIVHHPPEELVARLDEQGDSLAKRQDVDSPSLPLPATYVIGSDGIINFAFVDLDFTRRAEPADVLRALASLAP